MFNYDDDDEEEENEELEEDKNQISENKSNETIPLQ